ncbi:hypothetical protein LSH36_279g03068 [Paralvinella palmiformis]|uniref:Uncharacterized protein n=1 Tax=Paralvinella palmiformis TaxID=53620 RepID=A0AAD9N4I3_9ANNE|nr:hypothetical protein LSH36_279g03068 [Paralvinella palmiformis]
MHKLRVLVGFRYFESANQLATSTESIRRAAPLPSDWDPGTLKETVTIDDCSPVEIRAGVGFGAELSLARKTVRRHQGSITLEAFKALY